MVRKISKLLVLVLVLTSILGCVCAEEDRPVITIMCAEPTSLADAETCYATLYLEDRLGVDIQFNFLPSSEWQTKLEIMVTAGDKLSDILLGNLAETVVAKYGSTGVFRELTPYYDEYSIYLKAAYEAYPEYRKLVTFADGNMYSVARLQQQTHTDYSPKFFINKQWLENLGLDMPETTDDLYDVLCAFRDDDPNGNGLQDEIGLTGSVPAGLNPLYFLMGSFTFVNMRDYFQLNDGQLNPAYTTDGWREGLRFMAKLYNEGLMDPMIFTQDKTQLQNICQTNDDVVVGSFGAMNASMGVGTHPNQLNYIGTAPFIGPDGTQYAPYSTYSLTHNGFITRDCADPELAFQLLDLMWDKDASMVIRYGEENVDWEWVPEGTPGMFDASGMPATFKLLTPSIQSGVQNKWWNVWSPMYLDYTIGDGWADDFDPLNNNRLAYNAVAVLKGHIPEEVAAKITYTADEMNSIAEIKTNIDSYWKECMTLFIVGEMDIENDWDSYLEELDKKGLEQYMEVAQIAYDRTWKN